MGGHKCIWFLLVHKRRMPYDASISSVGDNAVCGVEEDRLSGQFWSFESE